MESNSFNKSIQSFFSLYSIDIFNICSFLTFFFLLASVKISTFAFFNTQKKGVKSLWNYLNY